MKEPTAPSLDLPLGGFHSAAFSAPSGARPSRSLSTTPTRRRLPTPAALTSGEPPTPYPPQRLTLSKRPQEATATNLSTYNPAGVPWMASPGSSSAQRLSSPSGIPSVHNSSPSLLGDSTKAPAGSQGSGLLISSLRFPNGRLDSSSIGKEPMRGMVRLGASWTGRESEHGENNSRVC